MEIEIKFSIEGYEEEIEKLRKIQKRQDELNKKDKKAMEEWQKDYRQKNKRIEEE